MIMLFTDFGHQDPYIGQMHRAIRRVDPSIPVIDLFHSVPDFNIQAAAYLLPQYCTQERNSVYCCVVDPGVGGARAPIIVAIDDCYYVGPDNGLFEVLLRRFEGAVERIDWQPVSLSDSFHGRDLFAPVCVKLARGESFDTSSFEPTRFPDWPDELDRILYIDHYGNAISGRRAGTIGKENRLVIGDTCIEYARTFSEATPGKLFWHENSNGLVEIAANQARASDLDSIQLGAQLGIE